MPRPQCVQDINEAEMRGIAPTGGTKKTQVAPSNNYAKIYRMNPPTD